MDSFVGKKKRLAVGILAHVDAGKTTLCEGLLYLTGTIRKQGRVDHGDAYLDTHALEKARGITIFSKQAIITTEKTEITLIDTPGHVDFSTEAERTLRILDYAILVISGTDGVQAHTETLWRLLRKYGIPTFIFINKMDISVRSSAQIMEELAKRISDHCIDFSPVNIHVSGPDNIYVSGDDNVHVSGPDNTYVSGPDNIYVSGPDNIYVSGADNTYVSGADNTYVSGADNIYVSGDGSSDFYESIALCDEQLLDEFLLRDAVSVSSIAKAINTQRLFPCFFGSALKLDGVEEFLRELERFTVQRSFPNRFGARVYKISRDAQGARLTHMRLTGGSLAVRTAIEYMPRHGGEMLSEKAAQIRVYSGARFEQIEEAAAGSVVTVIGLSSTYPGQGIGFEEETPSPILSPVLNYSIRLPEGCDPRTMLKKLMQLEEEDPELHIVWNEQLHEINAQLMGEVQIEILKSLIKERFDTDVEIDNGRIMYRETIAAPVEGIGHFEPLRHYAEVHLLLEPLEPGSGLVFSAHCSPNSLDINWQRLILTHLFEKTHLGVLTGSPITDMKITLVAGRASLSHTEGGDFRQATYRAVRQGLMKARSILLEPYYEFRIEVPSQQLGRAINDLRMMGGSFSSPEGDGEISYFTGTAPVSAMRGYSAELAAYTKGRGRLSCSVHGYSRCQNEQAVIEEFGYNPEGDLENTPDSVFCAHGAGFPVKWNQVENYMHIDTGLNLTGKIRPSETVNRVVSRNLDIDEKELEAIMLREFGPIKRPEYGKPSKEQERKVKVVPPAPKKKDYLIVDGYNIIFAWEGLRELAKADVAAARKQLMDIMSNFNGYKKGEVLLVFDGYRVKGNAGERFTYHSVRVAYTKENETADMFIERLISEIGKNYSVRVATSDGLIQLSSVRTGVLRMTAKELESEVDGVNEELHRLMEKLRKNKAAVKLNIPPLDEEPKQD